MRQWQMLTRVGAAVTAKRIAPHWQPPVNMGLLAVAVIAHSITA